MTIKQHKNKLHSELNIPAASRTIFNVHVSLLKLADRNARTHSRKQIRQIADSIREFGFVTPLLVDKGLKVVAGHGRLAAAREVGLEIVPCLCVDHLSAAQVRALALADNKIAANAGWDEELLALELQEIKLLEPELDLQVTGFSIPEMDTFMEGVRSEENGNPKDDALAHPVSTPAVTRPNDVWLMAGHRLVCGDARSPDICATLMAGASARMVFTDPPYNVPIAGHVSGLGVVQHREFAMATGEMSPRQFTSFLTTAFANMARVCVDGAIAYICMDWRHMDEMLAAGKQAFTELKNLIVWVKDNGGMGTFYRSRHELIFCYKIGTAPNINAFELGQHGRYRTNCWQYRGLNGFGARRDDLLTLHPTVKPVAMIADAIKDVSARGDIVLDLFAGSGSTLIAAHKTGRRGYLCEIDPAYCDLIVRRWETFAKDDAILEATGTSFEKVAVERSGPSTALSNSTSATE